MFGKSLFHRNFQNSFKNHDFPQIFQKMSKILKQISILVKIMKDFDFSQSQFSKNQSHNLGKN